jgi:glycosyltransferase involved in cell wall biosynthesis
MSNGKRTLVILTPGFPKDEADTACLPFLQTFIRSLVKADASLNIIVIAFEYPFFSKEYSWHNVTVIACNGRNRGKLHKLFLWRRIWKRIQQLVQRNHVIGFFSLWLGECALVGKYAASKTGIKHFTWILGQDAKENNRYVKRVHPAGKNLVAISDSIAERFRKNYQCTPGYVVPAGIDTGLFTDPLPAYTIDILGVGSLIPLKQFDVFIKMISLLSKKYPTLKAVIAGEGVDRNKLQSLIEQYRLQDNLQLRGETAHKNVLELMQQSKILLHPSSYEGFAAVCAEALYAGAKVVSFVQPMKQDFENWYVVKNEEEMFSCLDLLLDEKLRSGRRVLTYSSDRSAKEILALYK